MYREQMDVVIVITHMQKISQKTCYLLHVLLLRDCDVDFSSSDIAYYILAISILAISPNEFKIYNNNTGDNYTS